MELKIIVVVGHPGGWSEGVAEILEGDFQGVRYLPSTEPVFELGELDASGLVILTNDTPDKGGYVEGAIRELRKRSPGVKIAVMSTHADLGYAISTKKLGADDFITVESSPEFMAFATHMIETFGGVRRS